jgi:cell fate regulator YaaT (PSP1 superfamily)
MLTINNKINNKYEETELAEQKIDVKNEETEDLKKEPHTCPPTNGNGKVFSLNGHQNNHQNKNGFFETPSLENQHSNGNTKPIEQNESNHHDIHHDIHRVIPVIEDKSEKLSAETILEVQFQGSRREFFYHHSNDKILSGNHVIVETENGYDFGRVAGIGEDVFKKWQIQSKEHHSPVYSIKYKAGQKEIQRQNSNIQEQKVILEKTKVLIKKHNLDMRVTEVEWQFDRHRLTLYFLAPQRIDFRELVKDLAKEYKTRIELRQITHRERAKRINLWVGVCGRGICCSSFLHHIKPITIEHSKVQQLSANVTKLSGYCGRLKCCLAFEFDLYNTENERFPKLGSVLDMGDISLKLIKFDIFRDMLTFYSDERKTYRNYSLVEVKDLAQKFKLLEPKDSHCSMSNGFVSPEELQELLQISDF